MNGSSAHPNAPGGGPTPSADPSAAAPSAPVSTGPDPTAPSAPLAGASGGRDAHRQPAPDPIAPSPPVTGTSGSRDAHRQPVPDLTAPSAPGAGAAVPPRMPGAGPRLPRKSPTVAGLLSLMMPGIGQVYVGCYRLGFIHNVIFGMIIAVLVGGGPFEGLVPTTALFLSFFIIYNVVDAARRATLYNLALDGADGIELPELPDMNASLPKFAGSTTGGAALIALGVVLLSNTLLGLSLDWVASWWPLGLVGLGVYLLVKARRERRDADPPADGAS